MTGNVKQPRLQRKGLLLRLAFVLVVLAGLWILREFEPAAIARWLPVHTSCGAITGLPCIFCGLTRGMHHLLNGELGRALYFNWLVFPFTIAGAFLFTRCIGETIANRAFGIWKPRFRITPRCLALLALTLIALWLSQAYLAVSLHKQELLNPNGPLYPLFVR